jgi:hypothetical protein
VSFLEECPSGCGVLAESSRWYPLGANPPFCLSCSGAAGSVDMASETLRSAVSNSRDLIGGSAVRAARG